mmetsp:Transcript_42143/g.54257  ORF Transcript_42143/g.54257 Transcript_42143/m.54257 type:complete len:83 (+) Transcript_42143:246-494(+)
MAQNITHPSSLENLVKVTINECIDSKRTIYELVYTELQGTTTAKIKESAETRLLCELSDDRSSSSFISQGEWITILKSQKLT